MDQGFKGTVVVKLLNYIPANATATPPTPATYDIGPAVFNLQGFGALSGQSLMLRADDPVAPILGKGYAIARASPTSTWNLQTVDSTGDVGQYSSLALDSNNNPHISYYDFTNRSNGYLKYAKWTGSVWSIQTVDSGFSGYSISSSIASDSSSNPHISYYDTANRDLKYAKWTGSVWSIQTVDSTGDVGQYSSLALDSNNNPHISYYDSLSGYLKYAKWNGSAWSTQTIDVTVAFSSIVLDSNDKPHISYVDVHRYMNGSNYNLRYATWNGSVGIHGQKIFDIRTVDNSGDVGVYSSIAVDSNNNPHISYTKYAKWNGSAWDIQTVDSTVTIHSSLALDSNNNPHISYYASSFGYLKYAKRTGSMWSIQTVDPTASVGDYSSLVLDSNNNPHISYYERTNLDLKYTSMS